MKTKFLLFSAFLALGGSIAAQYSSNIVPLGASMTVRFDTTPTAVKMTLTGPSTNYLSVNFTNSGMASGSDGFVYSSVSSTDYQFVGVGSSPSADGVQDWTIISNTTASGVRTIVATRSLSGSAGDFAFTNGAASYPIAYARGSSLSLGYHAERGYANVSQTLGTQEVPAMEKFGLYPNPVQDQLHLKNTQGIKTLLIFDQNGRKIREVSSIEDKVDLKDLDAGVYYVELQDKEGNTYYHKMVKK